jgi:hypothetical protein
MFIVAQKSVPYLDKDPTSCKLKSQPVLNWMILAAWIETEGSIDSTINRHRRNPRRSPCMNRSIRVIQKDDIPLKKLSKFLENQGIKSSVHLMKPSASSLGRTPYFRLDILGLSDMDEVITQTTPYFITPKAIRQVDRYWRYRHATAEGLRAELRKN